MSQPRFNLVSEPWLEVLDLQGKLKTLSLREVFLESHTLRELVDPSPLSLFASLRLLWALSHRIVNGPKNRGEWKTLWRQGRFEPEAVHAYFDKWQHRFDLFDPDYPFMQVSGFETFNNKTVTTTPASRLLHELACGNNPTLFDHTTEEAAPSLSPADAARALLTTQAFGLGGGKGPTARWKGVSSFTLPYASHAPCAGAICVYADFGQLPKYSLYHTLVGNLLLPEFQPALSNGTFELATSHSSGHVTWERDQVRPPEEGIPTDYVELITWLSRYVRLIPEADGSVRTMCIGQGPLISKEISQYNPFALWRVSQNAATKGAIVPMSLSPERALWRSSEALFASAHTDQHTPSPFLTAQLRSLKRTPEISGFKQFPLTCLGLANDKSNPLMWRKESIPVASHLLSEERDGIEAIHKLKKALAHIDGIYSALRLALHVLATSQLETEGKSADPKDVGRLRERFLSKVDFWERQEPSFHRFMQALSDNPNDESAQQLWLSQATHEASAGLKRASGFSEGNVARVAEAVTAAQSAFHHALVKLHKALNESSASPH